jgi:hypothetical protein
MKNIVIAHLPLAALFVATLHLHAEVPIPIDFEPPDYFTGMTGGDYPTPGDYPSPWFEVDSGTSITDVNPISGTQSMLIEWSSAASGSGAASLWFTTPESYTSLTISADIRPHHIHTGHNNYVGAGGIRLNSDDSPAPGLADINEFHLAGIRFDTADGQLFGPPHTLNIKGGIGKNVINDDTGVDWISDTTYTITYELDLVAGTMTATVKAGASTIWSDSGALSDEDARSFRLDFESIPNSGEYALVDNISITGVQEPSLSIANAPDTQQIEISFTGVLQQSSDLGVSDPWTDIEPQPGSPWMITPSEGKMFFRIKP